MNDRACCKIDENVKVIKQYDPQPKNKSGSVRWYLYRWDDGKNGYRKLVRCNQCGTLYLVQAYQLHTFSEQRDKWFEDWYLVDNEKKAYTCNVRSPFSSNFSFSISICSSDK